MSHSGSGQGKGFKRIETNQDTEFYRTGNEQDDCDHDVKNTITSALQKWKDLTPTANLSQYTMDKIVGPSAWNDLHVELRSLVMTLPSKLYISLKSFFFGRDWAGSTSE